MSNQANQTGETTVSPQPNQPTKNNREVTLDSYQNLINQIIEKIDHEIEEIRGDKNRVKGVRVLRGIRKRILVLSKKAPRLNKIKRKVKVGTVSGFSRQYTISPELIEFLDLEEGSTLSRSEGTRAVCMYINRKEGESRENFLEWDYLNDDGNGNSIRDLRDPENKMRIIPDFKLMMFLKLPAYTKRVRSGNERGWSKNESGERVECVIEDDGLYYRVVQKLLSPHFLEMVSEPDEKVL